MRRYRNAGYGVRSDFELNLGRYLPEFGRSDATTGMQQPDLIVALESADAAVAPRRRMASTRSASAGAMRAGQDWTPDTRSRETAVRGAVGRLGVVSSASRPMQRSRYFLTGRGIGLTPTCSSAVYGAP